MGGNPSPDLDGDLDNFRRVTASGECLETVKVYRHQQQVNLVNSVNDVIARYVHDAKEICFQGNFFFKEKINLTYNVNITLLPGSGFYYRGDGHEPAIEMIGIFNTIQGGKIHTIVPMPEGLIAINSAERKKNSANDNRSIENRFNNRIKDIELISSHDNSEGDPRDHKAIVLHNTKASIINVGADIGTNYFTHISNVDIDGFSTGMHLRGYSNANNVRDIRMKNIDGYGIWLSGCVDNNFTSVTYENCQKATAIRIDNYVDDKYQGIPIEVDGKILDGTQAIDRITTDPITMLPDPNVKLLFDPLFVINEIIKKVPSNLIPSNKQIKFNEIVQNLSYPLETILTLPSGGFVDGTAPCLLENSIESDGSLKRFGLIGYYEDGDNQANIITNFPGDGKDVTSVRRDPMYQPSNNPSYTDELSLFAPFKDKFLNVLPATCRNGNPNDDEFWTEYYIPPLYNGFSNIKIFKEENGQDELQVRKAVLVEDREIDDQPKCEWLSPGNSNCNLYTNMGFGNTIYFCESDLFTLGKENNSAVENFTGDGTGSDVLTTYGDRKTELKTYKPGQANPSSFLIISFQ